MKIKITVDTDNAADMLALKMLSDLYLSQPAEEPMDEAELVEMIREEADTAQKRMRQIMAEKLYGSYQPHDYQSRSKDDDVNDADERAGTPLTGDWDRYR